MDSYTKDCVEIEDEELYALLEKAMSEEPRLTVSEELIQRTLRRAEETKLPAQSKIKTSKRVYRFMGYACVAAAAVLVLVIGGKGFFEGKLKGGNNMKADSVNYDRTKSVADGTMVASETEKTLNGMGFEYNLFGADSVNDRAAIGQESVSNTQGEAIDSITDAEEVAPSASAGGETGVVLSQDFIAAVANHGYLICESEAVFVFADPEEKASAQVRMEEMTKKMLLGNAKVLAEPSELLWEGTWKAGICAETETGMLRVLLGEDVYLIQE